MEWTKEQLEAARRESRLYLKQTSHPEPEGYRSDQQKMLPQPPLVKATMGGPVTALPRDFSALGLRDNLFDLLTRRVSSRVYTEEKITLTQLSFLLWATQGVKGVRGRKYATLRTVPCGGARHPFETYLLVKDVEGLQPGKYHYLPMEHAVEFLGAVEGLENVMDATMVGQHWTKKSGVIFYWSFVPYRTEWRYGVLSHHMSLIDVGHVGENLYLAATAAGLGTCGIGAYDQDLCDKLFGLDGEDEFTVYTETVGTVRPEDAGEEKAFYSFVDEAGW